MLSHSSIAVIDFEASCLGDLSYPIEVGIARWDGPGTPIRSWSTLIRPVRTWVQHGLWLQESQDVHGITPHDLVDGMDPHDVVAAMKDFAAPHGLLLCDGEDHDFRWLVRLTQAGGWTTLPFGLRDFDAFTMTLPAEGYPAVVASLEANRTPHRAGPDAVRLVRACVAGLGHPEPEAVVQTTMPD